MTYAIDALGNHLPRTSRYLWAAVGVLGTATLAMGAALVQVHTPPTAMAAPENLTTPASVVAGLASDTVEAPIFTPAVAQVHKKKVPLVPVNAAQTAIKSIAKEKMAEPVEATRVVAQAPKVVCADCGTVESVEPIQHETTPTGVGAIAGAVLGGLVGNQFGGGEGKAVATVIGAMGGGWAGNTVEKRMKKETAYRVDVRMDDGSLRTLEQNSPPAVGAQVTVDGNVISPAGHAGARGAI